MDDLIKLYLGIKLENSNSIFKETTIRAILSCIICDMPATRKVCGFLSYHSRFDCSKCLKEFTKDRFDSKQDFSGYDVESWTPRDPEQHKGKATEASNATARNSIQSSYGHDIQSSLGYLIMMLYATM